MPRRRTAAFSLLEILAVLALAGLITSLLLGGGQAMLASLAREDTETSALKAVGNARQAAVLSGTTLTLRFDEKTKSVDWEKGQLALELKPDQVVRFLPPATVAAELVGGRLREAPLARVHFYADGTCDPFRLELPDGDRLRIVAIDPWSCAALGEGKEAHAR